MPVIVIGADTPLGEAITDALRNRSSEKRAFVSSREASGRLRNDGFKVAVGDVSDWTHVEGASIGAFTAVLIAEAAADGRETSFANGPGAIVSSWLRAVSGADVERVILVGPAQPSPGGVEWAVVDPTGRSPAEVADEVVRLDETARI